MSFTYKTTIDDPFVSSIFIQMMEKMKLQRSIQSEIFEYNNQLIWNGVLESGNLLKMWG